jgi:hypothetical protein
MADLDILNYALTLEHLEDMMYQQAVASGALSGRALQLAQEFGAAEHQHAVTLTSVISQMGGTPVAARASYNFPAFSDQASTLSFLIKIEDTGVGAYLGQVGSIQSGSLLAAAASIYAVEALHTAALRTLVGVPANPNGAFEKPLDMATVLATAGPLLGPAAATATAQVPAASDDPVSHAADGHGRALWAMQHGGDASGYDSIDRMDQVTWNSVAIHGQ